MHWGGFALSVIPIAWYGNSGPWCSVTNEVAEIFTFEFFVVVVLVGILAIYLFLIVWITKKYHLRWSDYFKTTPLGESDMSPRVIHRIMLYPVIYFVCELPTTMRAFLHFTGSKYDWVCCPERSHAVPSQVL